MNREFSKYELINKKEIQEQNSQKEIHFPQ